MVNHKNDHARTVNSLAPPTCQSLKCIKHHNFGPVGPNCTIGVPLESLDQDEFNKSYDVILRHMRFSAIFNFIKNLQKAMQVTKIVRFPRDLTHRIFRPSRTKVIMWIFFISLPFACSSQSNSHRQTGSEAISRQPFFNVLSSNL